MKMNKILDRFRSKKVGKNENVIQVDETMNEFKMINKLNHFFAKLEYDMNRLELNDGKIHLPKIIIEYASLFQFFLQGDLNKFVEVFINRMKISMKSITKDEKFELLIITLQKDLIELKSFFESKEVVLTEDQGLPDETELLDESENQNVIVKSPEITEKNKTSKKSPKNTKK
ncbi:MAG: hypothetical protein HeimC3_47290 [Candidatus Heimdallarchaeota archaeon LC_3]|nr:MAG: hypothetical protein HeimC3_47290 [Candidatus Heimdallarchaeota archaeon LC_3]